MARSRGFSLVEVMVAIVTLSIALMALLKLWLFVAQSVGTGRRWTAMAAAAATEIARLEASYRALAPSCAVPPSGSRYTPDGVGLTWVTSNAAGQLAVVLEVRAAVSRRVLLDSIRTRAPCR
jgi:prepilin-type N-terminal cleavage/methylation domain-containing protein